MRLQFALVGVLIAGCTEPTLVTGKPGSSHTEAGSGGSAGKGLGGSASPPRRTPERKEKPERDAGSAPDSSDDEMSADAGEEPSAGESGSAGASGAGAGGGTAGATGGSGGAATPAMDGIVGAWSGSIEDVINRRYMVCIRITQAGMQARAGESFYTGALDCVGRLSYVETMDDVYSFNEMTVSGGAACPSGLLKLTLTGSDAANYDWYLNQGSIPEVSGPLRRTDDCP